ncbi:hypothetical protein Tco_0145018 [Tanacetum coccineum]
MIVSTNVHLVNIDAPDSPCECASSSTSDIHHPVQHQEIVEELTHEDTPINHDILHPSHNLASGDPCSAQSSSGNVNSAKPTQVNYPPDHLRRLYQRINLGVTSCNTLSSRSTQKTVMHPMLCGAVSITELSKVEPKTSKCAMIEDCLKAIRIFIAKAAYQEHDHRTRLMSKLAFSECNLQENALSDQPEGFKSQENPTHRHRLKKALMEAKASTNSMVIHTLYVPVGQLISSKKYGNGSLDPVDTQWWIRLELDEDLRGFQVDQDIDLEECWLP